MKHVVLLAVLALPITSLAAPVAEVRTESTRLHFGDVVPAASGDLAAVDLGPAPVAGGSRLVTRAELEHAAKQAGAEAPALPAAVRVVRKMADVAPLDLEALAQRAFAAAPRAHATLGAVKHPGKTMVPAGWDAVSMDLAKLPRKAGLVHTSMGLVFSREGETIARVDVMASFVLAPEHALPEVPRGSSVTLIIRRGSVEVTAPAVVTRDASFGDVVQVTVRTTGRAVRARLEEGGRAILEGEP